MGLVRKCDRCLKQIDPYSGIGYFKHKILYSEVVIDHLMDFDHIVLKDYDLCPECSKELIKFLNANEKNDGKTKQK